MVVYPASHETFRTITIYSYFITSATLTKKSFSMAQHSCDQLPLRNNAIQMQARSEGYKIHTVCI